MRLKTLRKERPAFENEGAIINGNRIDLSNSEYKPTKHRTNNTFAFPTSLNISPSDRSQKTSTRRRILFPAPSQATHTTSYEAIEAAYLEHGIRIHLNPATAEPVTQQYNQTTENSSEGKSSNGIQRHKAFINRNPSRSSSAVPHSTTIQDLNQDLRPFSALQHQTFTTAFEQTHAHNISLTQSIESQDSEHSVHMILPTPLPITNDEVSTATLIDDDPDLAYMSSLLQTANGDLFRDTIRRRAGLRATFAVHRQPQSTTNSKQYEKSSFTNSSTTNYRNSLMRNSTIAVVQTTTPSPKKIEKDIIKHASRIRTSRLKDYLIHHQNSIRSHTIEHISSVSNSPTRIENQNKRNKIIKSSKSISLEPLELLLKPASRPKPPPRATSLSSNNSPTINRNNHKENRIPSKKRSKSLKISFVENDNNTHNSPTTSFSLHEHVKSSLLNDETLPLMKTSQLDMITNDKIHQSNSLDSGYYDRSSTSGDIQSLTSLSIYQASNSIPSSRLTTSASTRRLSPNKKVLFEDQSTAIIIANTATYV